MPNSLSQSVRDEEGEEEGEGRRLSEFSDRGRRRSRSTERKEDQRAAPKRSVVGGKEAFGCLPEFEVATAPATSIPPGRDAEKEE